MNPRFLLAGAAAIGLAAWFFASGPEALPPPPAAAAVDAPQPGSLGQARWFTSVPSTPVPPQVPASASPVYGRNGRVIELGGLTVSQYIAARMGAARGGDIQSAYEVYQAESICAAIEAPVPEYAEPALRQQALRDRAALDKQCAGLSAAQVQERLGFLGTAARNGHLGAQIDFYMEGPYGRDVDLTQNPDDPIVAKWKEDALGYLKQAGNQCDHFALALLSTVYDAGQLTARDMRTSMAYSIAAAVPRKKPLTEEQLRSRFGEELSPAEFDSARQLGAQLAQQACPK